MSGPADVWGMQPLPGVVPWSEDACIRDHEGPCRLTVDAVLTFTFPVTIDVDKQAGEDEWDLRDRYHAELRNVALHWRAGWVPDVELCDARIEMP